jgi:hypothetical protein
MSKDGTRIGSPARELELRKEVESLRRDREELMGMLMRHIKYFDEANLRREAWGKLVNDSTYLILRMDAK